VVDGQSEVIVGVVPGVPGLETAVWRPLREPPMLTRRNHFLTAFARLTPHASIADARQQLAVVASRLQHEYPETNAEWTAAVTPLQDDLTANARPMVAAGFGAMALVLLVGAANIANLMLSRAVGRRREFAIRAALGAGRGRIARQLLTESTLLSLAGGLAGVAVAWLAVRGAGPLVERQLRLVNGVTMNPVVLGFALAISVSVGLLFGVLPALDAGRRDPYGVLKTGGDSPIARGWPRLTTVLTVIEFALSIVLLTGAGLLANSLVRLSQVKPGFEPDGVLTIRLAPPRARYSSPAAVTEVYRSILEAVRAVAGVRAAAAVSALAVTPGSTQRGYIRDGDPVPSRRDVRLALYHVVTPDYFAAMRIPLQGRAFDDGDRAGAEPVAVVSEAMARELWPGESAIGRRIRIHTDEPFARTIVGVARDVKQVGLDRPSFPSYFVPFDQAPRAAMALVVRTDAQLDRVIPEIRRRIAGIDPDLPLYDVQAYDQILRGSVAPRRLSTAVLGAFAVVAVGLAAIGIYAVMAAAVSRRVREIGVRLAVGARRTDVITLIVGDGLRSAAFGIAIGLPLAWVAARSLRATLFGVAPGDPWTYAAAVGVLTLAATAACYIPARRASRLDPLVTLKAE